MKYDTSKPFDKKRAEEKFNFYLEKGKKIELKIVREKRTLKQNGFLHVCLSLYAIEFGYTLQEAKTDLKRDFGLFYEKNGRKYLKSTTVLDTIEMTNFIEFIRDFAGRNGLYICSPQEYLENSFQIDDYIDSHKVFLCGNDNEN